ncbi:ThuA domain-containing protein [Dyadobacter sp. 3J3]|uniref:ThuA domain-containing protein n=1 Tax=Dyadobacter sp. 3J3 TaxID=2606600 RepID=UPI00135CE802|nr:ThuA domain-containing protein [Dyadobacter sp. 3J3]
MRILILSLLFLWTARGIKAAGVLIVADEIPAMEILAKALKTHENIDSKIVLQTQLPNDLSDYKAVLVYIHQDISPEAENVFVNYTKAGGKLILLHHSISSMKRKNAEWFPFLGVELPKGDISDGGYSYVGDISMEVVNLFPRHFITTHKISYPEKISYRRESENEEKQLKGYPLFHTEGFVNHKLSGHKTILMGFKFTDKKGKTWMQDRAAWCMKAEKGWIFYLQPGHAMTDFENTINARIVMNAVIYKF